MDVFVRILARLEAPLLQRHSGAVLDEELRHVRDELHDVLAAFRRLQEVREAVVSLEGDGADAHRSARLMEMVESTAQLQQALTQRIELVDSMVRARSVATTSGAEHVASDEHTVKAEAGATSTHKRKRTAENQWNEEYASVVKKEAASEKKPRTPEQSERVDYETSALSYMKAADRSASSSETESEHDDPLPTRAQRREPMELTEWEQHVHQGKKFAQRLFSTKAVPSIDDVTKLVDSLGRILANVPLSVDNDDVRGLAKGQFINLQSLVVRVFQRGQRNKAFVPLAEQTLRALHDAMANNAALHGLSKYHNELCEIQRKIEQYEITTYTEPETGPLPPLVARPWDAQLRAMTKWAHALIASIAQQHHFAVDDVTSFVASLESIITSAEVESGTTLESLAHGQFKKLLSLTVRVFQAAQHDDDDDTWHIPVLETAIAMLERASARAPELRRLREFSYKLTALKHRTDEASGAATSSTFNATKWKRGVDQLRTLISQTTKPHAIVSLARLDKIVACISDMLTKATAAPDADTMTINSACNGVLKSTADIFNRPKADATFLPRLNNALHSIERFSHRHERFRALRRYVQSLATAKARIESLPMPNVRPRVARATPDSSIEPSSPAGSVAARFEALVTAANELLAVPVSERTGRAPHFVFSLQTELKAAFPTKGKRATPSRSVLSFASDAVRKAVELLRHEPQTGTSHQQFLALLFAVGVKYHTLKLLIARSRDELSQYVYPTAKVPRAQPPPSQLHAVAVSTSAVADEAAPRAQLLATHRRVQS